MIAIIVATCLVGIAIGRLPILRMNRATIALVGAVAVILAGGLSLHDAFISLDFGTLILLFAVMILNVNLGYSGFFRLVAYRMTRHARSTRQLLGLVILSAGTLSAVFLNDSICLMLTPLVVEICRARRINPIPFLLSLALAANVGSAATVIGNPQNILIGAVSGIPFFDYVAHLVVPVGLGLGVVWLVIAAVYRRELAEEPLPAAPNMRPRIYRPLLIKSLAGVAVMLVGIVAGLPTTVAALTAAAFLLISRRIKPDRVLRDVDWTLLVFFGSLFILTSSIRSIGSYHTIMAHVALITARNPVDFALFSVLLSNLISNVPAVMLLRNVVEGFSNPHPWWLLLAMATTFAGNLTLLGSVANLIVAEGARKRGIVVSFVTYLKVGIPTTAFTLAIGCGWLLLTTALR